MRKVGDIAHSLVSEKKSESFFSDIFFKWSEIVGVQLANTVIPYKIMKMNEKNLLIVKSQNGSPVELQHDSLKIIKALNKHFKCNLFSVIRVIQK